jgi:murein DD-endopeptidase MepM/ murein hydrolase activator NlpD
MTILVMREDGGFVRRVTLSPKAVRIVLISAGVLAIVLTLALFDYVGAKFDQIHLENQLAQTRTASGKLAEQGQYQEARLEAVTGRMRSIRSKLDRMDEIDAYIRELTNMPAPQGASESIGVGGDEQVVGAVFDAKAQAAQGNLLENLELLEQRVDRRYASLVSLRTDLSHYEGALVSVPTIWPVRGWTSSEFGFRISPFTGQRAMHDGIDIATPEGMPVIAPANGIVEYVGVKGGYGNTVMVRHGGGVQTLYGHLQVSLVREGQKVYRGQRVALVGNTGRSTGPHLHYEIRLGGIAVNPRRYILQ